MPFILKLLFFIFQLWMSKKKDEIYVYKYIKKESQESNKSHFNVETKSEPSNYLECCFVWILIAFNDDSWSSLIRSNERRICFDSVYSQKFKYPATAINWHKRTPKFIRQNLKKSPTLCVFKFLAFIIHSISCYLFQTNVSGIVRTKIVHLEMMKQK